MNTTNNKTDGPLISIITAVQNQDTYIERCLDSVITQTYKNIEHILILGCSKDNTEFIAKCYNSCNKRIKILEENSTGIYSALNQGINEARGEFILILGADDWLEPKGIEELYNAIIEKEADFAVGYAKIYDPKKTIANVIRKIQNFDHRLLSGGMPFCHQAILVSKKCFTVCGLFNDALEVSADYEWIKELFLNNLTIAVVKDCVVNFSLGGCSTLKAEAIEQEHKLMLQNKYNVDLEEVSCFIDYINKKDGLQEREIYQFIINANDNNLLKSVSLHLLDNLCKLEHGKSLDAFVK